MRGEEELSLKEDDDEHVIAGKEKLSPDPPPQPGRD